MRIAYLVSQYPAPSHTFIRREIEELRRRGLEIDTFSIRTPLKEEVISSVDQAEYTNTWYLLPASFYRLFRVHLQSIIQNPIRYFTTFRLAFHHRIAGINLYPLFYFIEAIYLAHELKRRKIVHLHNHFAQAGSIVGMLASRFAGIKWSLTVHGTADFDGVAGALLNQKLDAAAFVACVSYFGRAQVMRMVNPENWSKLFIARCGINLENIPKKLKTSRDVVQILCVARLSPEKGLIGLMEAFSKALHRKPHMELKIIGDGPDRRMLEQKKIELNLVDTCHFLGRAPESKVFQKLAETDIFVMSSFMEGLPVVLMEALAVNVPVIAPRVAGIPELIEHGKSGLLFTPSCWDELCECLLQLSEDSQLREMLAAGGNRLVNDEFNIQKSVIPLLARMNSEMLK